MKLIYKIYLAFLLLGVLLTFLAFVGFLNSTILFFIFISILFLFLILLINYFKKIKNLNKSELYFSYLFIIIWSLHFLQVLVPETGFDALWYHLPVVSEILKNKGLVYLPELYQSINPLFADLYFLSGFLTLGLFGVKLIAYIFAVLFVFASYGLSRIYLNRKFSIIVAVIISTFQVVSWQSSSFYVDVAKGFFEISGLLFLLSLSSQTLNLQNTTDQVQALSSQMKCNTLLQKNNKGISFWCMHLTGLTRVKYLLEARALRCIPQISLLFFSASLGTKLFSILLIPFFIYGYKFKSFFSKRILVNILLLFGIPTLYYYFSYINTGSPFYSLTIHVQKLNEIGGQESLLTYVFYKVISLPKSLLMFITARDYVSPLLVIFLIPIFLQLKYILKNSKLKTLLIFSFMQWIIWWFVPPISTRYAISGFVTLLILGLSVVLKYKINCAMHLNDFILSKHLPLVRPVNCIPQKIKHKNNNYKQKLSILLFIYVLIAIIPRIIVARRSLKYIVTPQTNRQYLSQFYDGSIDEKINSWYF